MEEISPKMNNKLKWHVENLAYPGLFWNLAYANNASMWRFFNFRTGGYIGLSNFVVWIIYLQHEQNQNIN